MEEYNRLLGDGRVQGAVEQLIQPEEFQGQFDGLMKQAEKSARAAMWPEDKP